MTNKLIHILYCLTATAPLWIVLAITWPQKTDYYSTSFWKMYRYPIILASIGIVLVILFYLLIYKNIKKLSAKNVKLTYVSNNDTWHFFYVLSYLFPIASTDWNDYAPTVIAILLAATIFFLSFSEVPFPHPLMFPPFFKSYKVQVEGSIVEYLLISQNIIRNSDDVQNISTISEYTLIRKA